MTSKASGEYDSDYLAFRADNSNLYVELHIPDRYIAEDEEDDPSDEHLFSDDEFPIGSNETFPTPWPSNFIPPTNIHHTYHLDNKTSNIIEQKVKECFSNPDRVTYITNFKKLSYDKLKYLAFEVNSGAFYTVLEHDSKSKTEIIIYIIYPVYLDEKNDVSLFKLLTSINELLQDPNKPYLSQTLSDFIHCGVNITNLLENYISLRNHDSKIWLPNIVKSTSEDLEGYKIYLDDQNLKQ